MFGVAAAMAALSACASAWAAFCPTQNKQPHERANMAKVRLKLDPGEQITFKREVKIPTPDGKPLSVEFVFKHRTRDEMADLTERWIADGRANLLRVKDEEAAEQAARETAEASGETYIEPIPDLKSRAAEGIKRDVAVILECASDWNVEGYEFTAENIAKMIRMYNATASAVMNDYRTSIAEGRLGN
jgi:hypothetical protein